MWQWFKDYVDDQEVSFLGYSKNGLGMQVLGAQDQRSDLLWSLIG
jgi:hypothetical protein